MNEIIVTSGLILLLGLIFFVVVRQGNQQLKSINTAVHSEAKMKGLEIKSIISPGFREWKNSPFDKGVKAGSLGSRREFYRVVNCQDTKSSSEKTIWVRVTKGQEAGNLTLEWKDVVAAPAQGA